jgi:hypothetical protein
MSKTKKEPEKASKTCSKCGQPRISEILADAILSFEARIRAKEAKLSAADYLKLLQMQQELAVQTQQDRNAKTPREIRVSWIDPPKKPEAA